MITTRLTAGVATTALVLCTATNCLAESFAWVQYVAGGVEARVTTTDATCPEAWIDGAAAAMTVHAAPGRDYPVTTCKVVLPAVAKAATIGVEQLVLPKPDPTRILVIGDTGCRIKGKKKVQACNDPVAWQFPMVAEAAARQRPDLVVHVGDYHYRETACPKGEDGCANSPFGDTWAAWRADFFAPAAALLRTAPWIMTRGNHEECHRAGQGWSRTLEPARFDATRGCNGLTALYTIPLPGLTLAVMDVSTASEERIDTVAVARFRTEFQSLAGKGRTWVVLHRPIWSAGDVDGEDDAGPGGNPTLAEAAQAAIPANVQALISGHHHSFMVYDFDAELPAQIVSGHGGNYLAKSAPADPAGLASNGRTIKSGIVVAKTFGFTMLERQPNGDWAVLNHDVTGRLITRCLLTGRTVACTPVG